MLYKMKALKLRGEIKIKKEKQDEKLYSQPVLSPGKFTI
jgi:hypothetical protein